MKENSLYDQKSLRSITGKTADFGELAKDCVAFSNAEGGNIAIGIEDGEANPPAEQRIDDGLTTTIINKISGITHGVLVSADVVTADNGGEYIMLRIQRNPNSVSMTTSGKIFVRIGDNSLPAGPEDIARLAEDKGSLSWEDSLTKYNWQDADKTKLDAIIRMIKASDRVSSFVKQKETKELLDHFYLTDPDSDAMTQLGVLFIGKQTQRGRILNAPVIQCIKYDMYGEKVNKWLWDDYSCNPFEMINEVWKVVPEWQESTEISDGMFRRNIPAYPEKVIRELLSNSLVHRPYTIKGDIFINIYPEHIEVINPGRLPLGVTTDNILHTTKKRNDHMANMFYVLHLMEREGSGYDMMYETLLANGKKVPVVEEGDDYVMVSIDRRVISHDVIKIMQYTEQQFGLKQKQNICLGLIAQYESLTATQLIKLLNLRDRNSLRPWLQLLLEKGLVISTPDATKAKEYRVHPNVLKGGKFRGRTSLKRLEPYRLKELIMEDLRIYKMASIKEIQKRIGEEISDKKIRKMLNVLIAERAVSEKGSYRWKKYELIE